MIRALGLAITLAVPMATVAFAGSLSAHGMGGTNPLAPGSLASLKEGFYAPPDSVKPAIYWYWLSDNVSEEGVTRDLETMARLGIGRAYIGNIGLDEVPYGNVKLFSDQWWKVLRTALRTAAKVGVEIGMFNSPGWSQSGGPWVTPGTSMRYLATAEFHVKGPGKRRIDLHVPYDHFQDVATLAFPKPMRNEVIITNANAKIESTTPLQNVGNMFDGDPNTETLFPSGKSALEPVVIDIEMDKPFTARSLTLFPIHRPFKIDCEVQAFTNGNFHQVSRFEVDRSISWLSLGFMPFGPVTHSLPDVTTRKFRLIFSNMGRSPFMGLDSTVGGFADAKLSDKPGLDRCIEKQLGKMVQVVNPSWSAYKWPLQPEPMNPEFSIDHSKVINVTRHISPGGFLSWDVPEGSWVILRVGMVPTGVTNSPASPEGRGLEIDKMSKECVRMHFNAFFKKILDRIPEGERKSLKYVIADSYETGSQNWSDRLEKQFQEQFGYDPRPWLPVLAGHIVGTIDQSNRFLWDLRTLVSDLIAYNYVGGLRAVSHDHGLSLWLENYGTWGFPSEFLKYGGQADELSGEFWADGLYGIGSVELRAAASAAHIYGKRKVWSESWTSGDRPFWRYPALLRKNGDWSFAQGVNSTLLHVFISQPYEDRRPGINAGFGTEFNRSNIWFEKSKGFIEYLRRCNFMLQQGRPVVDVAYLIGEDTPVMTGVLYPELPRGYSFDYINAEVIENRLTVQEGKLKLPDGLSYSMLVLPPLETMRPQLLRKIANLVEKGAVVLGPRPLRSPSLQDYPTADRDVKHLAERLWGGLDGKSLRFQKHGKGMIMTGVDMKTALDMIGMTPDFSFAGHDSILYIHRELSDADVYFVTNQTDKVVSFHALFRVHGMRPEFWDAVSGERRALPVFAEGSTGTSVPLTLVGGQSVFIVFDNHGGRRPSDPSARNFHEATELLRIHGPWDVRFNHTMKGSIKGVAFDTLEDWAQHSDSNIRYFSGSAVYRTTFVLDTLPRREEIVLDIGRFSAIAHVTINGIDVGGIWTDPPQIKVGRYLRSSVNHLEIEITNTWVNGLVGDLRLPQSERQTWTVVNPYTSDSVLQPSGLMGPVRLLALGQATFE
ncbi:MAG: glycoside hydrolase family 2 [Bacteroidetes bacterium]|nr:glycoside hydrolase family 2 [Bacteroidota bacterium]